MLTRIRTALSNVFTGKALLVFIVTTVSTWGGLALLEKLFSVALLTWLGGVVPAVVAVLLAFTVSAVLAAAFNDVPVVVAPVVEKAPPTV